MSKRIIYVFLLFFLAFTLKGYIKEENKDTIWLYFDHPEKKLNYYLEINLDGEVLMRSIEHNKKAIVREGTIKKVYAKDFFRETKTSSLMNYGKKVDVTKILFYKGETIKISANIAGEIRRVIAPISSFSETFRYAFNQVYEQAKNLEQTRKYVSFLCAMPLEDERYQEFLRKVPPNYQLPLIETSEIKKNRYIFKAINNPWRLIPLPSKEEENAISDFMSKHNLYGLKSSFYLKTNRGNFELSLIE